MLSVKKEEDKAKNEISRAELSLDRVTLYAQDTKHEDAIQSYKKAANHYKIIRDCKLSIYIYILYFILFSI